MNGRFNSPPLVWMVLGVALFAIAMGFFFAYAAIDNPSLGQVAVPASLAFNCIGMASIAAFGSLRSLDLRVRAMEQSREQVSQ